jgi:hypothetical protein
MSTKGETAREYHDVLEATAGRPGRPARPSASTGSCAMASAYAGPATDAARSSVTEEAGKGGYVAVDAVTPEPLDASITIVAAPGWAPPDAFTSTATAAMS